MPHPDRKLASSALAVVITPEEGAALARLINGNDRTIYPPDELIKAGINEAFVQWLTTRHAIKPTDPTRTIFNEQWQAPLYLDGVHGLRALEAAVHILGLPAKSRNGDAWEYCRVLRKNAALKTWARERGR